MTKRHIYLYDECLSSITSPVVWAVQVFVSDTIAGFTALPNERARAYAAKELRKWRATNWAECRAVMLLDYMPEKALSARLRYYRNASKVAGDAYVAGRLSGPEWRAKREQIIREVSAL